MENKEEEREQIKDLIKEGDRGRILVMTEKSQELGRVYIALREKKLILLKFDLTAGCDFENLDFEEMFMLDSLMRSAASFGEINGALSMETESPIYNSFLEKKGFKVDDDKAYLSISSIVHYKQ